MCGTFCTTSLAAVACMCFIRVKCACGLWHWSWWFAQLAPSLLARFLWALAHMSLACCVRACACLCAALLLLRGFPQVGSSPIKAQLRDLHITAAKLIEVDGGKKAIVMFVPFRLLKKFHKIQKTLVEELEKKFRFVVHARLLAGAWTMRRLTTAIARAACDFSNHHVVIIAQRTMLKADFNRNRKYNGVRPRSRTLKAVQEAILEDLVYPTEIVGKRTRFFTDGSKLIKIHLNPTDQVNVETKLDTFAAVYKKLTNKQVSFEFPVQAL